MKVADLESFSDLPTPDPRVHLELIMRLGQLRAIRSLTRVFIKPETRCERLVQLVYGLWQLVLSFGAPRHRVLIAGKGLLYLSGEITLTCRRVSRNALRSLAAGQPILVLRSSSDSALRTLCTAMKIDETDTLRAILSPNPVLVVFAQHAGAPVVVHAAAAVDNGGGILCHLSGLLMARERAPSPALQALVPMPVERIATAGVDILIETHLTGKPRPVRGTSEEKLEDDIRSALPPLRLLHKEGSRGNVVPEYAHIGRALPGLLLKWPQYSPELTASLAAVRSWSRHHLPSVLVHGDYWLGNVLFDGESARITGILDWDCTRHGGCPGYDALHLVLVSAAIHRGHSVARCLEEVWTKNWSIDFVPRMLAEIERTFELRHEDMEYLAALLWLTLLWQRNFRRDAHWQEDMIRQPAEAFLRWYTGRGTTAATFNSTGNL